jgi:hypothetical protein
MTADVCPICGGAEHREISPGYVECTSQVLDPVPAKVAGAAHPAPAYRRCGHRFQVGVGETTPVCACGRYSIGRCQDCSQPLCGVHGSGRDVFLCDDCIGRRSDAARADRQDLTLDAELSAVGSKARKREKAKRVGERAVDEALRAQDRRMKEVVVGFLGKVAGLPPERVTEKRLVEQRQRWFGGPKAIWEDVEMESYKVYEWETSFELLDQREVYLLTSGQVVYRARGRGAREAAADSCNRGLPDHAQVEAFESFAGQGVTWSRRQDCSDGWLPFYVTRSGDIEPGRISDFSLGAAERIEDIERTTAWVISTLATYLQREGINA